MKDCELMMSTASDTTDTFKVGPDEPIVTNERGGMQARNIYSFNLIDAGSLFELARVMGEGAKKYAKGNWKLISPEEHFDHLNAHLWAWKGGDKQDDHLEHALARMMMLYATYRDEVNNAKEHSRS